MVVGRGLSDVPLQCTKKGSKNEGGVIKHSPPCSRLLPTAHVLGQEMWSTAPDGGHRTRGHPFLASEARGGSRRA